MKYLSIAQTAERWGIRIGSVWGIPENAEKPADARIKNGKYIKQKSE